MICIQDVTEEVGVLGPFSITMLMLKVKSLQLVLLPSILCRGILQIIISLGAKCRGIIAQVFSQVDI